METITMHDVVSSNVKAIGHDGSKTLVVAFLNGTTYKYTGVPHDVFETVKSADSVGSTFNTLVKKAGYPYERVA